MHFARIEKSLPLQKIYAVLSDNQWHTTYDIMAATSSCTVSTRISELRRNGFVIDCRMRPGMRNYEYRLDGVEHKEAAR